MKAEICLFFCMWRSSLSVNYGNISSLNPVQRQLYDFKQAHPNPIGRWTTSAGEPVDLREVIQLNADQYTSQYNVLQQTRFNSERIPERVVHATGAGAFGYFEVTHDVSRYTSADVFNGIGKRTPIMVRFSGGRESAGGSDLAREQKGLAFKFYTKEGNLDLLCLQLPVYFYRDPTLFSPLVHAFRKNPKTNVRDNTMLWDFTTQRPEVLHTLFYSIYFGVPDGYRRMDGFPIHTYEISNKYGETHYVKFNFRTEQEMTNLTIAEAAAVQGVDLDYFTRDLYNAIGRKDYPTWRLEMDVMTPEEIKTQDYDPFDVTVLWKNGTYKTVQIGRLLLNRNPANAFADVELSAFNPGNLVPGIPGPIDNMFKGRRLFYLDTQNHRLGYNHNYIRVNEPLREQSYMRDGLPPVQENNGGGPNYYPNSFSGPIPGLDSSRPKEELLILQRHAVDLGESAYFYNVIMTTNAQRQLLIDFILTLLVGVRDPVLSRALDLFYMVDKDLGKRVEIGLQAALINKS